MTQAPGANVGLQSYWAYGLGVASEIPLPELPAGRSQADVEIRLGRLDRAMTDGRAVERRSATDACAQVKGIARFQVRNGREIIVEPLSDLESPALRMFLLGQVFAMLLHQRGILVLHASAVAASGGAVLFLGPSGFGKSTSATLLHEAGYSVAGDDVASIRFDGDAGMLLPSFPQIKLWPETLLALGRDPASLPMLHPAYDKRAHRFTEGFADQALPVRRLYFLGKADVGRIEVMSAGEAVVELLGQSFAARMQLLGPGEAGPHLQQCSRLAASVPARRLLRTDQLDDLGRFSKLLIRDLGDEEG